MNDSNTLRVMYVPGAPQQQIPAQISLVMALATSGLGLRPPASDSDGDQEHPPDVSSTRTKVGEELELTSMKLKKSVNTLTEPECLLFGEGRMGRIDNDNFVLLHLRFLAIAQALLALLGFLQGKIEVSGLQINIRHDSQHAVIQGLFNVLMKEEAVLRFEQLLDSTRAENCVHRVSETMWKEMYSMKYLAPIPFRKYRIPAAIFVPAIRTVLLQHVISECELVLVITFADRDVDLHGLLMCEVLVGPPVVVVFC